MDFVLPRDIGHLRDQGESGQRYWRTTFQDWNILGTRKYIYARDPTRAFRDRQKKIWGCPLFHSTWTRERGLYKRPRRQSFCLTPHRSHSAAITFFEDDKPTLEIERRKEREYLTANRLTHFCVTTHSLPSRHFRTSHRCQLILKSLLVLLKRDDLVVQSPPVTLLSVKGEISHHTQILPGIRPPVNIPQIRISICSIRPEKAKVWLSRVKKKERVMGLAGSASATKGAALKS